MRILPEFDLVSTLEHARKPQAKWGAIVLTMAGYGS
jgi:hypothetical protein